MGACGSVSSVEPLQFNNPAIAQLMAIALQDEIGISSGSKTNFDDAKIRKGHYPIQIKAEGDGITIEWPSWIGIGAQRMEFGLLLPKKTDKVA